MKLVSVTPADGSQGIILQTAVVLVFDKEIATTTLSEQSFLLSGPGTVGVQTPQGLIDNEPATSGTEYVQGTFSFALNDQGCTVATFRPKRPLRPNVAYAVMVDVTVTSTTGEALDGTYNWSFTTGVLNLKTPPAQNPLPSQVGRIRYEQLIVTPSSSFDDDLHQITIEFPEDIDPDSFDPDNVAIDLQAFLQDPDITVPQIATKTVTVQGNKLIIQLTFNPES